MDSNLVRYIIVGFLIFAVILGLGRLRLYQEASRLKRSGIIFVALFIVLTIFYMIWPSGV
jgi:hypothetical protein